MKQAALLLTAVCLLCLSAFSKEKKDSATIAMENQIKFIDSVESAMKYENGIIKLPNGFANLNVSDGFKFLNAEQSNYVLTTVWGNPSQQGIL